MRDFFERLMSTYQYVLEFHPIKYLGIAIMICGPLYMLYLKVFRSITETFFYIGLIGLFIIGIFVWHQGWDPYA